ncbi:MAG: lactonase family protein [Vicinamibacterales bacterium]
MLLALGLASSWTAAQEPRVPFVYVSGYRPEITIFRLDTASGTVTPAGRMTNVGQDPSFLAFDPAEKFLFAVNETDPGRVRSFTINQANGALTPINDVPSAGSITAHLSTERTGRWLLVANYGDSKQGTIASIPIAADGRLGAAVDTREFGIGSMAHQIRADPGNRFVFVPLKGGPAVAQLVFDPATGRLKPNVPPRAAAAAGAGPRHMDFHPSGRFAYVINELDLTMTAYAYDAKTGLLRELQILPTLPAAADKVGASAADVHVHRTGRFLYGSNRGHNSIVIYRLDEDGRMTLVGHESRGITRPRNFTIDPTGTLMLVANQDAANLTIFRIDQNKGTLEPIGKPTPVGVNPSFVGVAMLAGK